jgi:putative transposase
VKREQGRLFRTFKVIDEGNREVLGIEVATSIPSLRLRLFASLFPNLSANPLRAEGTACAY